MTLTHRALFGFSSRARPGRQRAFALASTGLVLVFLVLAVGVVALAQSPSAGPAAGPAITARDEGGLAPSQLLTPTIFLPMVARAEPLPSNAWLGEYYANSTLSGDPAYTVEGQPRIDYDWGEGAPTGLPNNYFSIRWTGAWGFEAGEYTFFVYADDGVRLWLDDQLLIDAWTPGLGWHLAEKSVATQGVHELKLEYFENTGDAGIQLRWRRTDFYPPWQGDYYDNNAWLEDGVDFQRTDSAIQFDWGLDCPEGLSDCDNFSVSWSATRLFEPGTHRIYVYADEGYQLKIDGALRGSGGWYDGQAGGSEDVWYPLEVAGLEQHQIRYDFHDRGTLAEARLWIEYLEHPAWTAEYFSNRSLSGSPVAVDTTEETIFYDWGLGKPKKALPSGDNFSIRWSGERYFHSGCYRFKLFADDGVRLWVDGELLVDEWHDGRAEHSAPLTYLSTGYHEVVVEYFESTGEAEIRLWWE
jgi:hypothetical protein